MNQHIVCVPVLQTKEIHMAKDKMPPMKKGGKKK